MGNKIKFTFKLDNNFNIENLKQTLNTLSDGYLEEDRIKYMNRKSMSPYYYYDYNNQNEDIAVTIMWTPANRDFTIFIPDLEGALDYSIRLIKKLYPVIGCSGYGNDSFSMSNGEADEVDKGKIIARIWAANLFSHDEVKKIGKDKLFKAPAEVIEEFEDGAVFLMIHKNNFSSDYSERKKLREYLGVK